MSWPTQSSILSLMSWLRRTAGWLGLAGLSLHAVNLSAAIPQAAKDDPRYKLGYLVVTHYAGVDTNGAGDSLAGLQTAFDDAYTNDLVALVPAGTYVISDSLKCFQWWNWRAGGNTFQGGGPYGDKGYVLLGSALGARRPVIKLADAPAGNFDDTNNVRPLLVIRLFKQALTNAVAGTHPAHPMGVPANYDINTASLFNCSVRGLDFDCNGHAGAVGVVNPSAQGAYLADIRVNATNAFAGFYGLPGRHYGAVNIEVDGGRYGVRCGMLAGDYGAGSVIFGGRFYGQTVAAIDYSDFVSLVMVGFHITKSANPVLTLNSSSYTAYNGMVLQDGVIDMGGGSPTAATLNNTNGKTLYVRNVFVRGATNLVKSTTLASLTATGAWSRIDEYSYTDQRTTSGLSTFASRSMINGVVNTSAERVKLATANSGAPPADLLERHLPPVGFPRYEGAGSQPAIVPTASPYNAIPGDGTNDTPALQRAIDDASAAGHGRVFIPKFDASGTRSGMFELTNTLVLHSNTVLFGAGKTGEAGLRTHVSWKPALPVSLIETDDQPAARTYLGNLELSCTNLYIYPFTAYHWKAGRSSCTFDVRVSADWLSTIAAPNPNHFAVTRFSGSAGGRHYFFPLISDMVMNVVSGTGYRSVRITGTTQPLWFYGFNLEGGKEDMRTSDADIFDAANVRLLGWKREGRASMGVLSNAQNLVLYAAGGMRDEPDPGVAQLEIRGTSTNLLIANVLVQSVETNTSLGLTLNEAIAGAPTNTIVYPEGVSLYKRGATDDSLMYLPANQAPSLLTVSSRATGAGVVCLVTNTAADPEAPPQTLAFSLLSAPTNATLNSTSGVFSWRPLASQANSTNLITVSVTDNGTPNLSATQSFSITVGPVGQPVLLPPSISNGLFRLGVTGDFGPDYTLLASTNLTNWSVLGQSNSPRSPFWLTDTNSVPAPRRFFRVRVE